MNKVLVVDGRHLKIWPSEDGFCISDDGGWLPGAYDSEFAAIEAFKLTFKPDGWGKLKQLNKTQQKESRLITFEDIRKVNE